MSRNLSEDVLPPYYLSPDASGLAGLEVQREKGRDDAVPPKGHFRSVVFHANHLRSVA